MLHKLYILVQGFCPLKIKTLNIPDGFRLKNAAIVCVRHSKQMSIQMVKTTRGQLPRRPCCHSSQ